MTGRLYTIKEVAKRTGLSTQLIRKWEERYEAVTPQRMANGYRGYTTADIETLSWLKQRVDHSHQPIAMAVMERKKNPIVEEISSIHNWQSAIGGGESPPPVEHDWKKTISTLITYFEHLNQNGAQRLYEELISIHQPEKILKQILEPTLIKLGELWVEGIISEYQEHFGSHFIRDKILSLRSLFRPSPDSPLLVTACGPGERHELGILFLGFYAMKQGFRVIYLGASPSEKGLLDCLREQKPAAFTFSFSIKEQFERAKPFLFTFDEQIHEVSPMTYLFIGGQAIEAEGLLEGTERIYMLAGDVEDSVNKIASRLLIKP